MKNKGTRLKRLVCCFYFFVYVHGELKVIWNTDHTVPKDASFLTDSLPQTCAAFRAEQEPNTKRFTTFRILLLQQTKNFVNLSLTGENMTCQHDLHVMPVTASQNNTWTVTGRSCPGFYEICSGSYNVKLFIETFFDTISFQGNDWLILMRRRDGSVNFTRDWQAYKCGFGSLTGEFWAGNENIHLLTTREGRYSLRIDLTSHDGESAFAEYNDFWIGPESDRFRLHLSGYDSRSTLDDSMSYHNNMPFSTPERDNDRFIDLNCAMVHNSSWWFNRCKSVELTAPYGPYPEIESNFGIIWKTWGLTKFAKFARMMIRRN